MTEKYGFMPGTHEESRDNPPVRSKFDKSQGKGLPAPHLSHPGQVAKETGSKHPGFNESGHMLAREVGGPVGDSGIHKVTHHSPASLGSGMAEGRSSYHEPNMGQTDRVGPSHSVSMDRFAGHEPDPVHAGTLKSGASMQRHTEAEKNRVGGESGTMKGHSRQVTGGERVSRPSTKQDAGALAGDPGARNRYTGGRGKM